MAFRQFTYFGNGEARSIGSHRILARWVQHVAYKYCTIHWFLLAKNVLAFACMGNKRKDFFRFFSIWAKQSTRCDGQPD